MLLLTSTSDIVRVVTDAAGDIEIHASWVDNLIGAYTPGRTNTASITTATTTTIVAAPAASTQRNVVGLNIRNNHASQTVTVTVEHSDGTNIQTIFKVALQSGQAVIMNNYGLWSYYDVHGGRIFGGVYGFITDTKEFDQQTLFTNGNPFQGITPLHVKSHRAVCKTWCKASVAGASLAGHNISSVSDTGAGIVQFNFTSDFQSSTYSVIGSIERPDTTMAVSNLKYIAIRNSGKTFDTCTLECWDGTATTAVQEDPQTWHLIIFGRNST